MNKFFSALVLTALIAPIAAHSAALFEPKSVSLWDFWIEAEEPVSCVHDVTIDWKDMGVIARHGKISFPLCSRFGPLMSTTTPLADTPMVVRWIDSRDVQHEATIEVARLLAGRPLYGGQLILQFDDTLVALYLVEPKPPTTAGGRPMPSRQRIQIFPQQN